MPRKRRRKAPRRVSGPFSVVNRRYRFRAKIHLSNSLTKRRIHPGGCKLPSIFRAASVGVTPARSTRRRFSSPMRGNVAQVEKGDASHQEGKHSHHHPDDSAGTGAAPQVEPCGQKRTQP